MRKIIVYNVISLDGYQTGPGNDPTVMFPIWDKGSRRSRTRLLSRFGSSTPAGGKAPTTSSCATKSLTRGGEQALDSVVAGPDF